MSTVFRFAEESCWNKERFRQSRKSVTFRVTSIGKLSGERVNATFVADFGVYYDPDDEWLISFLRRVSPKTDWDRFVYWKKPDHSGIDVIDPDNDRVAAHIRVNRGSPTDPSGEMDRTNVIDLNSRRVEME